MLFSTVNGTTKKVGQEAESEPLMMPWSHQALLGDDHDDEYEYDEKTEKKREVDACASGEAPAASPGLGMLIKGLCFFIWVIGGVRFLMDKTSPLKRVVFPNGHIDIGQHNQLKNTTLTESNKKIDSTWEDYHGQFDENTNKLAYILKGKKDGDWKLKNKSGKCDTTKLNTVVQTITDQLLHVDKAKRTEPDSSNYEELVNRAKFCGVEFSEGPSMLAVLDKNFVLKRYGPSDWHDLRNANRYMFGLFWMLVVGGVALFLCFYPSLCLPNVEGFPLYPYIATIGVSFLVYYFFGFTDMDNKFGDYSPCPNPFGWNLHKTLLILGFVAAISVPFLIIYWSQDCGKMSGVNVSWLHAGFFAVVLSLLYFFFGYGLVETKFDKMTFLGDEGIMYAKVLAHCLFICVVVGFFLIPACKSLLESDPGVGKSDKGFEHTPLFFGFLVIIVFIILTSVIAATASLRQKKGFLSGNNALFWLPVAGGLVVLLIFAIGWLGAYLHHTHGEHLEDQRYNHMVKTKYAFGLPMWSIFVIFFVCVFIGGVLVYGTKKYNQYNTVVGGEPTLNSFRMMLCAVFVFVMFVSIAIVTAMDKTGKKDPVDVACVCLSVLYVLWFFAQPTLAKFHQETKEALNHLFNNNYKWYLIITVCPLAAVLGGFILLAHLQAQKRTNHKIIVWMLVGGVCLCNALEFFVMASICDGSKGVFRSLQETLVA